MICKMVNPHYVRFTVVFVNSIITVRYSTFKYLSSLRRLVQGNLVLSFDAGLVLGERNSRMGF